MIPRTFPSTYETANGDVRMVVYFITDLSGLERWVDYIPVKFAQLEDQKTNSYDNNGVHLVDPLSSTSGKQAWVDYIPVYADPDAEDAWYVSAQGYIPVGFSAAPTLSLDFTSSSETLDPRVTFSRGSLATRTNSSGVIEYAPHNLLTYSEQFDNAAWTKALCTVAANAVVAPDGTTTADSLVEDTTNGFRAFVQSFSALAGTTYTISFNVKAAARSLVRVYAGSSGSWASAPSVIFDLSNGTVASGTGGAITPVGTDGWYRCSVVGVFGASGGSSSASIGPVLSGGASNSYLGTGETALHIWGAQLNVGALQPYYPTTVKNLLGYSEAFDNAAWTKSNSFIQTNLLAYSQEFDNAAWVKTRGAVSANTIASPNGTLTADTYTADGSSFIHSVSVSGVVSGSALRTFSIFVKAGTQSIVQLTALSTAQTFANFDLSTGVIGSFGTDTTANIQSIGDGWWRCSITSSASTDGIEICLVSTLTSIRRETNTLSTSIYIWGAQLVQGSTPGDYQQTFSAALPVMYEAPNGTMTADKLVENTANNSHFVSQSASYVSGTKYTCSVYAKAAERTSCRVALPSSAFGAAVSYNFNLSTGTFAVNTAGTNDSASIVNIGDGWYRCSVSADATSTTTGAVSVLTLSGTITALYTGDGTSGIYIWGAQLSDSASLDTYVNNPGAAPSAAAYYGPRFDYDPVTLAPKGLLIEEQRTNLLLQSENFLTTWGQTRTVRTANADTSPDGTVTADSIVQAAGSTTAGTVSQTVSVVAGDYVISVFAKPNGRNFLVIRETLLDGTSNDTWFDVQNGTVGTTNAGHTATITASTNSYYRCSIKFTANDARTSDINFYIADTNGSLAVADDGNGLYLWGAQIEAGAFPTSYIPTTTAQVTRAADAASMTGTNFSSWYAGGAGTVYSESAVYATNIKTQCVWELSGGSTATSLRSPQLTVSRLRATVGGTFSGNATGAVISNNTFIKATVAWQGLSGRLQSGATGEDVTGAANLDATQFIVGGLGTAGSNALNGTIKKLAYYPSRLSNVQLQALTS